MILPHYNRQQKQRLRKSHSLTVAILLVDLFKVNLKLAVLGRIIIILHGIQCTSDQPKHTARKNDKSFHKHTKGNTCKEQEN